MCILHEGVPNGCFSEMPSTLRRNDDDGATLDDLREAVMTLEELKRTARRVLGGAHPLTEGIEDELQDARAALRAREETQPSGGA